MKSFESLVKTILLLCVLLSLIVVGCISSSSKNNSQKLLPQKTGIISCNLLKGYSYASILNTAENQSPELLLSYSGFEGAKAWLEERPDLYGVADSEGKCTILDVPEGSYKVVAFLSQGGSVYKMRSSSIEVLPNQVKSVNVRLQEATNFVTGTLKDESGAPLPYGTRLSLWGEDFEVKQNGKFVTPPLPDLGLENAIQDLILYHGTASEIKIPVAFISDTNPSDIEMTVSSNKAVFETLPLVTLIAQTNNQVVTQVKANQTIELKATVFPYYVTDEELHWVASSGFLDSTTVLSSNIRKKSWTAPSTGTLASISLEASVNNKTSKALIYIKVEAPQGYRVIYDANNASSGSPPQDEQTYIEGEPVTIKANSGNLLRTGYTFTGWTMAIGDSEDLYPAGSMFNMPAHEVTLYARWLPSDKFRVTYNGNSSSSGEPPIDSNFYQKGQQVVIKGNSGNLTKLYKTFIGWTPNRDTSSPLLLQGQSFEMPAENVTLYAVWQTEIKGYTVTYHANGSFSGSPPQDDNVYQTSETTTVKANTGKLANPGHLFSGWNTAPDGSQKAYAPNSQITIEAKNIDLYAQWFSQLQITSFVFNSLNPPAIGVINQQTKTISIKVPYGTNLLELTPTILHTGESVIPDSGASINFTETVVFTVTAPDLTQQTYNITVNIAPSPAKSITAFNFDSFSPPVIGTINEEEKTITLSVPYGVPLTMLTPTIAHTGASIFPTNLSQQNFSEPLKYLVTAEDSSTAEYIVYVDNALNSAKQITAFSFPELDPPLIGEINEVEKTISVIAPYGTIIGYLKPSITFIGEFIHPSLDLYQDFRNPFTYRITAEDLTSVDYTVFVTNAPSNAKKITYFAFNSFVPPIAGDIDHENNSINVLLPNDSDLTSLIPTISFQGASIFPESGVETDFSSDLIYTVTAADNSTIQYFVRVTTRPSSRKNITRFDFESLQEPVIGLIDEQIITLRVQSTDDITALVPTIEYTGVSIMPQIGVAQDFTSDIEYEVTAEDGSTQKYFIIITIAPSSQKTILSFDFEDLDPPVIGEIDQNTLEITLTVPAMTDVTYLTPTITFKGMNVSPQSGLGRDFTTPLRYTVVAQDFSQAKYLVTVNVQSLPSSEKEILSFAFNDFSPPILAFVDQDQQKITATFPPFTDLSRLVPTIIHSGATISPSSLEPQNFTKTVTYSVVAEDYSVKDYDVILTVQQPSSEKQITSFVITDTIPEIEGEINQSNQTITFYVPQSVGTFLTPRIDYLGVSISPTNLQTVDFSGPVEYSVIAEDYSVLIYTVNAIVLIPSSEKDITSFKFEALRPVSIGNIDDERRVIDVYVPFKTDISNLLPSIVHTGVSISPDPSFVQDFTNEITYTVTAEDGTSKQYKVRVFISPPSSEKEITKFDFEQLAPPVIGVIDQSTKRINLTVPYQTDITNLLPTISHAGETILPAANEPQNFTSTVVYTVTAQDSSFVDYTIFVTVSEPSSDNDILSFDFNQLTPPVIGVVNQALNSVVLTVPYGTAVTNLVPEIVHNGVSIQPNTLLARDFTLPVTYKVTAQNAATKEYEVVVNITPPKSDKRILNFSFNELYPPVYGNIDNDYLTITLNVAYDVDPNGLVPTITHNGTKIVPETGVAQNFTLPVAYTVTAEDSSSNQYMVTVLVADPPSPEKDIVSFKFNEFSPPQEGIIEDQIITFDLPFGSDVTNLLPTIVHTGVRIEPQSEIRKDFTNQLIYKVTAEDNSTKNYAVIVRVDPGSDAKEITAFNFNSLTPPVIGIISQEYSTIKLEVPSNTDLTNLYATITHTGLSVAPPEGINNFTSPLTYCVTAQNSSKKCYNVSVILKDPLSSDKQITKFVFDELSPPVVGVISEQNKTISLHVPYNTDIARLRPDIEFIGYSVTPPSRAQNDFREKRIYTVTAEDFSEVDYEVEVTLEAPKTEKEITYFAFDTLSPIAEGIIDQDLRTINIAVSSDANVSNIVPKIEFLGESLIPPQGTPRNFDTQQTYIVVAEDGSTKSYTVIVTKQELSDSNQITKFAFETLDPIVNGIINDDNNTITLFVPPGNPLLLVPSIKHTGQSINPAKGAAVDFSTQQYYVVTAQNGSQREYLIHVHNRTASAEKKILSFDFRSLNPIVIGTISEENKTINLTVPYKTDLTYLAPSISIDGLQVTPQSLKPQDFSEILTYTVTAEDATTQDYVVTVSKTEPSSEKRIDVFVFTSFSPPVYGSFNGDIINLTVPPGSNVTSLKPNIVYTGESISPTADSYENFSSPVYYTVTAEDGSTRIYTVIVTIL